MTNLNEHEQLTLVNSLVLDAGVLQGRVNAALSRLRAEGGQVRAKAVETFLNELSEATTRLRQGGLHPDAQETLW